MVSARLDEPSKRAAPLVIVGVLIALALGVLITINVQIAAALAAVITVFCSIGILKQRAIQSVGTYRWLPAMWVVMLFASSYAPSTENRTPLEAAAGRVSSANVIEAGLYVAIALIVAVNWRRNSRFVPLRGDALLVGFVLLGVLSTGWSIISLFTFVRALQMAVPVALAVFTARIWAEAPGVGKYVWRGSLRLFVIVAALLSIAGFITGGAPDYFGNFRYAWPTTGWDGTSIGIGIALLVLIAVGRRGLNFSVPSYSALLIILAAGEVAGKTRSCAIGLLFSGLILTWFTSKRFPVLRYLAFLYYVIGGILVVLVAKDQIFGFYARQQPVGALTQLSGRIPLWSIALRELLHGSLGTKLFGFGLGASRVLLFEQVSWAGTAHNAWIEIALGLGLAGLFIAVGSFLVLVKQIVQYAARWRDSIGRVAVAVFSFIFIVSLANVTFAQPGLELSIMALLYGSVKGQIAAREQDLSRMEANL